jgi:hypothetical protein
MSNIDLEKKEKIVRINLEKRGVRNAPTMRVVAAIDVSGSMGPHMRIPANGQSALQRSFDQLLGVAVTFDDDGSIDVFEFDNRARRMPTATASDFGNYIEKNIRAQGGTEYSPVIDAIVNDMFSVAPPAAPAPAKSGFFGGMFGKKTETPAAPAPVTADNSPVLVLFFTDGANSDGITKVRNSLTRAQQHDIYFQMVGVGSDSFATLQQLGDEFPNTGFIRLDTFGMSDAEVYEALISEELCEWVAKFQPAH